MIGDDNKILYGEKVFKMTHHPLMAEFSSGAGTVSSLPFVVQMAYMDTNYIGEYNRGKMYPIEFPR